MKPFLQLIRVEWFVAAFCAWHAADLLQAWRHSPYDRFGWVALLIWLLPAARAVWRRADTARHFKLAMTSLALTFIGVIGDLNVLVYCGLAGIIGALAGVSGRTWLWLLLAVCWMPVFGWACSKVHLSAHPVPVLRLIVAVLAAGLGFDRRAPTPQNPAS
jgi:hypothetical protein